MAKFTNKKITVEALSFREFVAASNILKKIIVDKKTNSFFFHDHQVTKANDNCYLIQRKNDILRFQDRSMIMIGPDGDVSMMHEDAFQDEFKKL